MARRLRTMPSKRRQLERWLLISDNGCLRVSPSRAAIGSQAIKPISGALTSKVDAVTGISRADSASVKSIRPFLAAGIPQIRTTPGSFRGARLLIG